MVTEEDAKVFELKKEVVKWMVLQAEVDKSSYVSGSSRTSIIMDVGDNGPRNFNTEQEIFHRIADRIPTRNENEDQLKRDLERTMGRLSNQRTLVEDLLESTDTDMMNHEIQALDKAYDDMIAAASLLRECSTIEKGREVSLLIDAEDE